MSTKIHDLPTHTVLGISVPPQEATESQNGSAIDLLQADGNGFAILCTGTVEVGTTVGGKLQESADASNWSDITGATFANTTASDSVQSLSFSRTFRYLRAVITLSGGDPSAHITAIIGQQKKAS